MASPIRKAVLAGRSFVRNGVRRAKRLITPKPDFYLKKGTSWITGDQKIIENPFEFGRLFKEGSLVFELHVDSNNPRDVVQLLLRLKKNIPRLQKLGIAGVYGDTPNTALIKKVQEIFHIETTDPPLKDAQEAWAFYRENVRTKKYPAKYLNFPMVRLIIPF